MGKGTWSANLAIDSSSFSRYAGLFGHSAGLAIRNVAFGPSCSVTSSYSNSDDAFQGIIGLCIAGNRPCTIEDNVNMDRERLFHWGHSADCCLHLGGYL